MSKPLRVLIVEDSEDDALLVVCQLKSRGYEPVFERVDTAEDMKAALSKQTWDIIISDHNMPNFSAPAALMLLRESGLDLPFIILSGKITDDTAVSAMKAGAGDYISKNNLSRLAPAVERELREAEVRRQHRRAEEELRKSEKKYRNLVNEINDGFFIIDEGGAFTFANKALAKIYGFESPEELIGRTFLEFIKEFTGDFKTGKLSEVREVLIVRKDGSIAFIEFKSVPIMEEGRAAGSRGVVRDITERKQMEERLIISDRLASVGKMASGVAHELNNPLTGVIGFAELLMEKGITDDTRKYIQSIYNEAQRAATVVKNLLTFSRQHKPSKTPVNVKDVIKKVLELRAYEQRINNIRVKTRFAPKLPKVMADPFQLQQVFLNIIINAEHSMIDAHNGGVLTITTEKVDSVIKTFFTDDGPGISKEDLGHVFDPFFTTKEVGKGTGLGLSICHGIVAEHGGRIYAQSEPGQGVTFIVELPIQ